MAELNMGKGLTAGKVASNVQKKLTRAQEKVMQKLGKADETKDIAFEEGVINFNKQYTEGSKLQRDLRAYLEAVKAMHESSKNVQSCLADMYEPEWCDKDEVDSVVEDCDVLWTDYHQKLVDHALISMDTYLGQFPDIKARIAKRDRKLVDYDSARHNYAATHKTKKDKGGGIKITKPSTLLERATPGWAQGILSAHNVAQTSLSRGQAEEELDRAQKVFEEINIDLQEELPSLWNSRVGFYVSTFQSLAGFEEKFHKEMSRLDQDLYDVLVNLERTDTSRKTGNRGATPSGSTRSGKDVTNHTLRPGGPPPIPKSPSKLRPAVPPPPKATPSKDLKTENIINLFDSTATPDISITSPTQFDSPAVNNLLDMDLDSLTAAANPASAPQFDSPAVNNLLDMDLDSLPAAANPASAPQFDSPAVNNLLDMDLDSLPAATNPASAPQFDSPAVNNLLDMDLDSLPAAANPASAPQFDSPAVNNLLDMDLDSLTAAANPASAPQFDSPAVNNLLDMDLDSLPAAANPSSAPQPADWDSWPEDSGAGEAEDQAPPRQHYDPVAAAAEGWGDDGTQPIRYDPVAAANEGWGDDGTRPLRHDPVASANESWGDDGSQPVKEAPGLGSETPDAQAETEAEDIQEEEAEATAATGEEEEEEGQGESAPEAAPVDVAEKVAEEMPAVVAESTNGAPEPEDLPAGFLHKVQVMHDYNANDSDELEMKAGDVVLVVSFDNPEEQDEGWLMGYIQSEWLKNKESAVKGVFPENFTQKL